MIGKSAPSVLVTTWFYDNQPGFLDFGYRIQALAQHFDTHVIVRDQKFISEFSDSNATFEVMPTATTKRMDHLLFLARLAIRIRALKPDLVVLLGSQMAILPLLLPKQRFVVYWNEHPSHFFDPAKNRNPIKRWFNKLLFDFSYSGAAKSKGVMAIGEAHRDDLYAHGVPADLIHLIYMGVSPRFSNHKVVNNSSEERPLSVIYTGSVQVDRGRDVMIEGLKLAIERGANVRLTIVGAGAEELRFCEQRRYLLKLGEHLSIIGRVPGGQIPSMLAGQDVGVCIWADKPWWRFNPPTKLFEYLVAGLPILASNIRTHTAYIQEGHNGLIFDYDPQSFANVLIKLATDKALQLKIREGARQSGPQYLWTRIEPQFLEYIHALIKTS